MFVRLAVLLSLMMGCHLYFPDGDRDDPPPQIEPPDGPVIPDDWGTFVWPEVCEEGCCDACAMMASCTTSQTDFDQCTETCEQSQYIETHGVRCLALRIYWIDEEGCKAIEQSYRYFEPGDPCTESQF